MVITCSKNMYLLKSEKILYGIVLQVTTKVAIVLWEWQAFNPLGNKRATTW